MTPEGIFENPRELFHAIETGLSADIEILSLVPELDNFTFISSSDIHSASFSAVGRESTVLEIKNLSYEEIIKAIRENHVLFTVEFPPSEGKYFLTGHRGDRPGHQGKPCYYSPYLSSTSGICPICKKKLNIGVFERVFHLQKFQGGKRKLGELRPNARPFIRAIPLYEVVETKGAGEREYKRFAKPLETNFNSGKQSWTKQSKYSLD